MKIITRIFVVCILLLNCLLSIEAQNNSNAKDSIIIEGISLIGNNRTKTSVIELELVFKKGDTLKLSEIDEAILKCKENLLKTSLFNFVDIKQQYLDSGRVIIEITLQERWYLVPKFKINSVEENFNAWALTSDFNHLNISMTISDVNFRGNNEKLSVSGSIGFNKSLGLKYYRPFISSNHKIGFGAEFLWISNQETTFGVFDYKYKFLRSENNSLLTQYVSTALLHYRPTINIDELLSFSYNSITVDDTLFKVNPRYYLSQKIDLLRVFSKLKIDYRDNKSYSLEGSYYDLIAEKQWNINNSKNREEYSALTINSRWYYKFSKKWFGAIGITGTKSWSEDNSQIMGLRIGQSGLEVRSFEYYLIPINAAAIGRVEFKYQLFNQPKKSFKFMGNPKFGIVHYAVYASVYADGALVDYDLNANYEQNMHISKNWLSSVGAGFDLSTYYDIVLRTEYSYNFVFQKWNFFIHFKAAI
jgi:outer membrane protein assembly factor BamA